MRKIAYLVHKFTMYFMDLKTSESNLNKIQRWSGNDRLNTSTRTKNTEKVPEIFFKCYPQHWINITQMQSLNCWQCCDSVNIKGT